MTKTEAKKLFGSVKKLADVIGYTTSYFYSLPDYLPQREADRINGAALRIGLLKTSADDQLLKTSADDQSFV